MEEAMFVGKASTDWYLFVQAIKKIPEDKLQLFGG